MSVLEKVSRILMLIIFSLLYVCLKLLEGMCRFAQLLSGWLFRIWGFVLLLTAFGCLVFQLDDLHSIATMVIAGVVSMFLPVFGEVIITGVMFLEGIVRIKIKYVF